MLALREAGYALYLPFGENTRSDLLIEDGNGIARVQCKTGRIRNGAIVFHTTSLSFHHKGKTNARPYTDDVDYFAVYCPATRGTYLIPIDELDTRWSANLRLEAPRNGQRRGIRLAADYAV